MSSSPSAIQPPIDAVYTWVDGADPAHRRLRAAWRARETGVPEDSGGASRFRDRGELRYSLRSLELYAPWVRNVYLVTNGQVPAWIDRANPRLRLVTHAEMFADPADLPTFNSFAIEANLHRIPGLSENYLYFNDDFFLGAPVTLEDFYSARTGHQMYFEDRWQVPQLGEPTSTTGVALANTQAMLDRRFGARRRYQPAHVPVFYRRAVVDELLATWPEAFRATSGHRFRSGEDMALHLLYAYFITEGGRERHFQRHVAKHLWPSTYGFVSAVPNIDELRGQLRTIQQRRPKFFCINDDLGGASPWVAMRVNRRMRRFLDGYFPEPSGFERPASPLARWLGRGRRGHT